MWSGNLALAWSRALPAGLRLELGADLGFESESFADNANSAALERAAHALLDLHVSLAHCADDAALEVFARNLTDRRVVMSGVSSLATLGIAQGVYNAPRSVGVALRLGGVAGCR